MEGEVSVMTTLLTGIGSFFTQSVEWLGDVLTVITGNPALLILVIAMPVIGFSVGLLNRLIKM
jgi:hypothetical protein